MSIYKILCFFILSFFLASCIYLAAEDTPAQKKSTVLRFIIQPGDSAMVTVYNLIGNVIVQKSFHEPGLHRINIEILNLPAGIYLVRIKTSHSTIMKKAYVIP
jgi:cell division protein YceG involved in septum cleavage